MKKMEYRFKIIILGASGSGKSCLLKSICNERIPNTHDITVGVDYNTKTIDEDNKQYKFCLWDTSGNKTFMPIVRSYFGSSLVCLLVFDLTDKNNFTETIDWYHQYIEICPDNTVILVGNKVDKIYNSLIPFKNSKLTYGNIGQSNIEAFINRYNITYIETSTITRQNVDELLQLIKKDIQCKIITGKIIPNIYYGLTLHEINDYPTPYKNKKENIGCCTLC